MSLHIRTVFLWRLNSSTSRCKWLHFRSLRHIGFFVIGAVFFPLIVGFEGCSSHASNSNLDTPDWPMYHLDPQRTGYLPDLPDPHQLAVEWQTPLDGAVYGEPLVVGDRVLVATENDSVYSLDVDSGQVLWQTTVGTPVALSELPCGNIDPLGITSTPVYDAAQDLVFVAS